MRSQVSAGKALFSVVSLTGTGFVALNKALCFLKLDRPNFEHFVSILSSHAPLSVLASDFR